MLLYCRNRGLEYIFTYYKCSCLFPERRVASSLLQLANEVSNVPVAASNYRLALVHVDPALSKILSQRPVTPTGET